MRNHIVQTFKSLTIVAIVSAMGALTSCSDEEGAQETENSFSIGGSTIKIDQALLATSNVVDDGGAAEYVHYLLLLSKTQSIEDAGSIGVSTGEGRLDFSFYSNDPTLKSGTFVFSGNNAGVAGEIWDADGGVSVTTATPNDPVVKDFQVSEGKLVVTRIGSRYAATFTGKAFFEGASESVNITATYIGGVSQLIID